MKKLIISSMILAIGVTTAVAYGGSRLNTGPSIKAVKGTPAGMPPSTQTLYAVINADGSEARTFPTRAPDVTSSRIVDGSYEVLWTGRNMTGCSWKATIGNAGDGTSADGFIQVDARFTSPTGVYVQTRDVTGAFADRPFHLVATC